VVPQKETGRKGVRLYVGALSVIVIVEVLVQPVVAKVDVQASVVVEPMTRPVTPDVGEAGLVMVADPETTDQSPVPVVIVFPASVVVVVLASV